MAKVITNMMSFDAGLRPEPTENTWEELQRTLAYLKDKKVNLSITTVGASTLILGAYLEDSGTYLRIALNDARF